MERKLNYILSVGGVSPAEKLCGGTQGENRATAIVVTPDNSLLSAVAELKNEGKEVFCSFDVLSETGEFFEGEKRETEQISEPFYLTEQMTASGLDVAVIVKIGSSDSCFYKAQIKLYFEECPTYKILKPKEKELAALQTKAEEILFLLQQKTEEAENMLEIKCSQAATSAALAAAHLNKMIALNESTEQCCDKAVESEAAAKAAALSAEKDFQTVKELFASALQNIGNHNFDPASHEDIRDEVEEMKQELNVVSKSAESSAEFANLHENSPEAHKDIRNHIGYIENALDGIIAIQNSLIGGGVA